MKKLVQRFLLKMISAEIIENLLSDLKINRCVDAVILGKKSRFYQEARVFNFRNDKSCIKIGEGSHIRGELLIFAFGGKIQIGSNSYIGEGTRIWSAAEIHIGDNVLISHNCNIMDTDSHERNHEERAQGFKNIIEKGHSTEKGNIATQPIYIDDYAWISYNVSILKGIRIGKGARIGAGSVVTKDVPEYATVVGNPAAIIGK